MLNLKIDMRSIYGVAVVEMRVRGNFHHITSWILPLPLKALLWNPERMQCEKH